MLGAEALDVSRLQGRTLLNLDSEAEGVFTVGCAGGTHSCCILPLKRAPYAGKTWRVTVDGLQGGHSGESIHKGRGNASVLLGRVLRRVAAETELRLIRADGGLKDNAIPALAEAVFTVPEGAEVERIAAGCDAMLKRELRASDGGVSVKAEHCGAALPPMDAETTDKVLYFLTCAPNGVQEMSMDVPGLPQTSLNLGILQTTEQTVEATFCLRSSVGSQKRWLQDRLACLTEALGGSARVGGDYPAWEYRAESPLRERMAQVYREQYGVEPRIEVIHAGLECGLFSGKLPGLDCVSIGPDIPEIHTPRERLSVPSVARVWRLVLEILKRS